MLFCCAVFNTRQFNCLLVAGVQQGMAGVTKLCLQLWQSIVAGRKRSGKCCDKEVSENLQKGWRRGKRWRSPPGQVPVPAYFTAALGDAGDCFAAWTLQDPDIFVKNPRSGFLLL